MAGPSSQEPAGPWDTTFNRAMNTHKGRDKSKPPTSAGRVSGFGTAMKFIEYYSTDTDNKRTRRKPSNTSAQVAELTEEVAELKKQKVDQATVDQLVAEKVDERLRTMFPQTWWREYLLGTRQVNRGRYTCPASVAATPPMCRRSW